VLAVLESAPARHLIPAGHRSYEVSWRWKPDSSTSVELLLRRKRAWMRKRMRERRLTIS
jgi:hypothetical protein